MDKRILAVCFLGLTMSVWGLASSDDDDLSGRHGSHEEETELEQHHSDHEHEHEALEHMREHQDEIHERRHERGEKGERLERSERETPEEIVNPADTQQLSGRRISGKKVELIEKQKVSNVKKTPVDLGN